MIIDKEKLAGVGFSGFTFPPHYKKRKGQMMAWSGYVQNVGFLTLRVILVNSIWHIDLVTIDYDDDSLNQLEWIKEAKLSEIITFLSKIGTNRL